MNSISLLVELAYLSKTTRILVLPSTVTPGLNSQDETITALNKNFPGLDLMLQRNYIATLQDNSQYTIIYITAK